MVSVWDEAENDVWGQAEATMTAELPSIQIMDELHSGKRDLVDSFPVEFQCTVANMLEDSPNPDETKKKLADTLYYSFNLDEPPSMTFDLTDELNKMLSNRSIKENYTTEPPYRLSDIKDVYNAIKEMIAPTNDYTRRESEAAAKEWYDRFKWITTFVYSLGGRIGPKGLSEQLKKEAEEFHGFGAALAPMAGKSTVLAFEWGWLYPKLFRFAGAAGSQVEKIPQVQKSIETLKSIGGVERFIERHPYIYKAATRAISSFAKGEAVGQTMVAVESLGKDKTWQEWLADMNKRGALLGGVAATFSAALTRDQYNYIQKTGKYMRLAAYNRHVARVKQGFLPKHSADMLRQEGEKIQDVLYYLENKMLGVTPEMYGDKRPEMSPEQAAKALAKNGYILGESGKTSRQLSHIKRPKKPTDVLMRPEPVTKVTVQTTPAGTYTEAYNPQTGQKIIIPEGYKVELPKGFEVSEPINITENVVPIELLSPAQKEEEQFEREVEEIETKIAEKGKAIMEQGRRTYVPARGALEEMGKPAEGVVEEKPSVEKPTEPEIKLERNIPLSELKVGDIVAPEARYITSAGYYFQVGKKLEVVRINPKSITVKTVEGKTVRIPKKAAMQKYQGDYIEVEPKFARQIEEAKPTSAPAEKEAWEITKEEYIDYAFRKGAPGTISKVTGKPLRKEAEQVYAERQYHESQVRKAIKQNKPVPHHVLEEYKGEKWADEALAKKIKLPETASGMMPVEAPGLTKAEAEHLGKREAAALRAGQKLGAPIGYKKGYQQAALEGRRKLDALRVEKIVSEKSREDALGVIKQFVPKEEQSRYTKRLIKAKTAKDVEKLTAQIEEFIDKYEHKAAVREFKRFIKETRKKYRSGEVELGKLNKSVREKLLDVIDKYDKAVLSEEKAEELQKHKEYIQRVAGSIADAFSDWEELDENGVDILQLPNYRIQELKRLEKISIAKLDTEQIEFIQNELSNLVALHDKKSLIKQRTRAERVHKLVTDATNEIHNRGKELTGEIKEPGYLKRFVGIEQAQLRTLVDMATSAENDSTIKLLVDQLFEGNRERIKTYKDFILYTREQIDKAGLKLEDIKKLEDSVKVVLSGKEIEITYDQLLSLWMDTQAEGNLRRLLIARGHNLRGPKRLLRQGKPIRIGKIELAELQDAVDKLPDTLKKLGDIAFRVNRIKQAPAINKTSIDYQNYPIALHEKHWPFPREIERLAEGPKAEISVSIELQGRYLPRTGGNARHEVLPFTTQFMKGLQMDAAYSAMTMPMQEAKALLANKKWRSRMKEYGNEPIMNAITTLLRRTQGLFADQSVAELMASRLLSGAGKSILSLRPTGFLVQTASIPASYEIIEPKYFLNPEVPSRKEVNKLKELSPTLWLRWEGKQFDYALGTSAAQKSFNALVFGKYPVSDRLVSHYTWGDEVAISYIWEAAQRKIAEETNLKKGSNEFQKRSLDLLYRAIETQPQWDMLHRTLLTSHPSPFLRGSLMFMSARNAQYNVTLRAYDGYSKGRIDLTELSKRTGGVLQANVLVSLFRRLIRIGVKAGVLALLFGLKDEDEDVVADVAKEQTMKEIKKIPLESALNVVGLSAFGQIGATIGYEAVREIQGRSFPRRLAEQRTGNILFDITNDVVSSGVDSTKLAKQIWTDERYKGGKRKGQPRWEDTAIDMINDTGELVAQLTGLPFSGPRTDIIWPIKTTVRAVEEKKKAKKIPEKK